MTARTLPLWQQVFDDKIRQLNQAACVADISYFAANAQGFISGISAAQLVTLSEVNSLRDKVKQVKDERSALLKKARARYEPC